MSENNEGFGTVKLEREFDGYKMFKLRSPDPRKNEDSTELVVRLIPSMKSYRSTGEWKFFYSNHFGHYGNNNRNPDKPRPRPFGCIQKKDRSGEITTHCPKCDQIESMRKKYDARKAELKAKHPDMDEKSKEFKEACSEDKNLKVYADWLSRHNADKKWWINVMAADGSFGCLQLSFKTVKERLDPLLKKLRDDEKIDAFDPSGGIWLRFTRIGQRLNVTDSVEVVTESVKLESGATAKVYKAAALTPEQVQRALKVCPDLSKEVVKFLPAEKIQALIDSNGDQDVVDEVWDGPKRSNTEKDAGSLKSGSIGGEEDHVEEEPDTGATDTTTTAAVATTTTAPTIDPEEAELEARMAALKKRRAREKAASEAAALGASNKPATDPASFLSKFAPK